jgi:hypothetical protein
MRLSVNFLTDYAAEMTGRRSFFDDQPVSNDQESISQTCAEIEA